MKVKLVNNKKEDVDLNEKIWKVRLNSGLIAQAVRTYQLNQRASSAHTKTRAEVSGGGKKPWRQKGTGRARHGSTRSPIWVKGGVAFGPTSDINWKKKLNKKMKRLAFRSALSARYTGGDVMFIDMRDSKDFKALRKKYLPVFAEQSVLLLTELKNNELAFRNVAKIMPKSASQINIYDVLRFDKMVVNKGSIKVLEERLSGE